MLEMRYNEFGLYFDLIEILLFSRKSPQEQDHAQPEDRATDLELTNFIKVGSSQLVLELYPNVHFWLVNPKNLLFGPELHENVQLGPQITKACLVWSLNYMSMFFFVPNYNYVLFGL